MNTSTTNAPFADWNGQPLIGQFVGLMPEASYETTVESWMAGSPAGHLVRVWPVQVADFLQAHESQLIACSNAAEAFWAIDWQLRSTRSVEAVGSLRRAVEQGRFVDIQIWRQLLQIAEVDGYATDVVPIALSAELAQLIEEASALEYRTRRLLGVQDVVPLHQDQNWLGQRFATKGAVAHAHQPLRLAWANTRAELKGALLVQREQLVQAISHVSELRGCYRPATGTMRFRNGLPNYDSRRLKAWLQQRWNSLRDSMEYPSPPARRNGETSGFVVDWGRMPDCDDEISLWAQLEFICRAIQLMENSDDGLVRPQIQSVPRQAMDVATRELFRRGMLTACDGKALLRVSFPDLEIRCLAAQCRHWFGRSGLADNAVQTENLTDYVAAMLNYQTELSHYGLSPGSLNRITIELLRCTALKRSDRIAHHLLQAVCPAISRDQVRNLRERLVEQFDEVRAFECDAAGLVERALGPGSLLSQQADWNMTCRLYSAITNEREQWRFLDVLAPHEMAAERFLVELQRGISAVELTERLLAHPRRTITGRARGRCLLGESTAEHLDVYDDVIKAILYELAVHGYVAAELEGDLIVEIPVSDDPARLRFQIEALVIQAGSRILDIPVYCHVETNVRV